MHCVHYTEEGRYMVVHYVHCVVDRGVGQGLTNYASI